MEVSRSRRLSSVPLAAPSGLVADAGHLLRIERVVQRKLGPQLPALPVQRQRNPRTKVETADQIGGDKARFTALQSGPTGVHCPDERRGSDVLLQGVDLNRRQVKNPDLVGKGVGQRVLVEILVTLGAGIERKTRKIVREVGDRLDLGVHRLRVGLRKCLPEEE